MSYLLACMLLKIVISVRCINSLPNGYCLLHYPLLFNLTVATGNHFYGCVPFETLWCCTKQIIEVYIAQHSKRSPTDGAKYNQMPMKHDVSIIVAHGGHTQKYATSPTNK